MYGLLVCQPGQFVQHGPLPGMPHQELELGFPQLSREALDIADIQSRLPKPPGRPRQSLKLQRA